MELDPPDLRVLYDVHEMWYLMNKHVTTNSAIIRLDKLIKFVSQN